LWKVALRFSSIRPVFARIALQLFQEVLQLMRAAAARCRHRWTETHSNAAFDSDVSEIRPSENPKNVSEQADSGIIRRMSDTVSFHHALVSGWLGRAAA
jgi:hypothetical protein